MTNKYLEKIADYTKEAGNPISEVSSKLIGNSIRNRGVNMLVDPSNAKNTYKALTSIRRLQNNVPHRSSRMSEIYSHSADLNEHPNIRLSKLYIERMSKTLGTQLR